MIPDEPINPDVLASFTQHLQQRQPVRIYREFEDDTVEGFIDFGAIIAAEAVEKRRYGPCTRVWLLVPEAASTGYYGVSKVLIGPISTFMPYLQGKVK